MANKKNNNNKNDKNDKNDKKDKKPLSIVLIINKKNKCNNCTNKDCKGGNECSNNILNEEKRDEEKRDEEKRDEEKPIDDDFEDDDFEDDYYNEYDDDDYNYDDNNKKEDKKEDKKEEKNNKRKLDDTLFNESENLDIFFRNIIDGLNKDIVKNNKKNKKTHVTINVDEFKEYFTESEKLLTINKEINSLVDLINLGKTYDPLDKNRYVINLRALNKCVSPLEELNSMIGMKNVKEMIIDLIFFRLQNLEDTKEELWHLVIQGTPGSGKTEVAKIIGKIYYSLGITKKDKFTLVKRSDLIGKYLGHTAKMTQEVFDNAKGGILFIDEAYSLGNPEQRDSFSKECIDTINQNLTENRETVVFIAGYKDQLDESFFSYNPGLNRRFKMRLTIDKYNAADLRDIFIKKIKENNWNILNNDYEKEIPLFFFEKNLNLFKYNGGDMENLWHLVKIVHSRRIFGKSHDLIKNITYIDLEKALKLYCENEEVSKRNNKDLNNYLINTMYC